MKQKTIMQENRYCTVSVENKTQYNWFYSQIFYDTITLNYRLVIRLRIMASFRIWMQSVNYVLRVKNYTNLNFSNCYCFRHFCWFIWIKSGVNIIQILAFLLIFHEIRRGRNLWLLMLHSSAKFSFISFQKIIRFKIFVFSQMHWMDPNISKAFVFTSKV